MKKSIKLGKKLSTIIRAAVADMKAVQHDKRYVLAMFDWHAVDYSGTGKCGVCMAGAIIACRSGAEPDGFSVEPRYFDDETADKLLAIDCVRKGDMRNALYSMPSFAFARMSDKRREAAELAIAKAHRIITNHYDHNTGHAATRYYTQAAKVLQAAGL